MIKKYKLSLFIFRRDLRIEDNHGLQAAFEHSEQVIPCFIFDNRQVSTKNNPYFGDNAFLFMLESLEDLQRNIENHDGKLFFFSGIAENIVEHLLKLLPIDAVFLNRDYTPFSQRRDAAIKKVVIDKKRDFLALSDALLHEPEEVYKNDGNPYTIYTPFYQKASTLYVKKPEKTKKCHFYQTQVATADDQLLKNYFEKFSQKAYFPGGRTEGLKLLKIAKHLDNYAINRDFPEKNTTSHLSAHHKFGTISIRESYDAIDETVFRKELYWRDFFTHIAFHFSKVFSGAFHEKYNHIRWVNSQKHFQRWCDGQTGFPIVDAGMRELNETGYMHNRVRMITASFLVKDLHVDWRWGEQYFATKLIDYDPAVNNGNWQWAASTGCDAQPYFRIFNPLLQQKRFDPDERYILHWVPERYSKQYPSPMVDHSKEAAISKELFKLSN